MPARTPPEKVTITLDGRTVEANKDEVIIAAAERAGVYIPRFCYHPRMKPVGMCRMCLVDVKGPRGFALQPACFLSVADGQEIVTDSPAVKKAQDGVLEFLLVNHPLDCPVCDKGGECPLQDQTFTFGPGESRFVEEKRHWAKPIALSDLVLLDRERCIQCARCIRFADEVAGDPQIDYAVRGDAVEVATFPDAPFSSYFSGNTVQICPVGALTSVPYRFKARPWDLEQVESSCTSCSVGCRVAVQSSGNRLTRYLGIDSDPVNQGWLCDKGRFDFESVDNSDRLATPLVRKGDDLVEASWGEALSTVAKNLGQAKSVHGGRAIAILGGSRLPNEDAYAWSKLARTLLETDNVDAQLGDGLPADVVLGLPGATIEQACQASAVILVAPDLKEELPVLYLRLRQAAIDDQLPIIELAPQRSGMSRYAAATLLYRPGDVALLANALVATSDPTVDVAGVPPSSIAAARAVLAEARAKDGSDADVVVVLGRPSLAEAATWVVEAASILNSIPNVSFLSALRRSNVRGAMDMGLAPGVLPGRVSLAEGRAWFAEAWGSALPASSGLDATGVLTEASEGRVAGLILLGADPFTDFPDKTLARRGLDGAGFVVAVDCYLTDSARRADVVLPAATYGERAGSFTNLEGRVMRLGEKITPPGVAWPDWMIATELAFRMGGDLGFDNLEEVWDEIERLCPSHTGLTGPVLAARVAKDGLVVPLAEHEEHAAGAGRPGGAPARMELATDTGAGVEQPVPGPIDPMADPGIGSVETQGVPVVSMSTHEAAAGELTAHSHGATTVPDLERPPLLRFSRGAGALAPRRDGYSLRLITGRTLWDKGTLVQHSPHLAHLVPEQRLRVHPADLAPLGLEEGGRVRVTSARGSIVVDVMPDPALPRGAASLLFNVAGDGVTALIDATAEATDVRLETL